MGQSNWVHLEDCDVIAETDKAILVERKDGSKEWFTRSQISEGEKYEKGD